MKKTILTAQDHEFLNQIDEYTLYDFLSNKMLMLGGYKFEHIYHTVDIDVMDEQEFTNKLRDNIDTFNTMFNDSDELKWEHKQLLEKVINDL